MSEKRSVLRLTTEAGEVWNDPSEDALFEYMGDLGESNAWLVVERLDNPGANERFRVTLDEQRECFDVELRQGSTVRRSRGLAFSAAHEVLTRWAFDLPEWDTPVSWDPPAAAG